MVLKSEFISPLNYPIATGYIEFVGVKHAYKRKGTVSNLLQYMIDISDFTEYILDVTDIIVPAIGCYTKTGFAEIARKKVSFPKQKGCKEKVFMRYVK